jgi:hypothetical protein
MIDLRKPLEGTPGLLLMAALILFGAAIGMGVAIGFTWIPMSDALANFLGGVVGAGLGAALAVMGAVYVQHREARERLRAPLNQLANGAERIMILLSGTRAFIDLLQQSPEGSSSAEAAIMGHISTLREALEDFPDGEQFSRDLHNEVQSAKALVRAFIKGWEFLAATQPIQVPLHSGYLDVLNMAMESVVELRRKLPLDAVGAPLSRATFASNVPHSRDISDFP